MRQWTPAPHRDLPPRKPPKPHDHLKHTPPPTPKGKNTDWDIFKSIVDDFKERRRRALDTIKKYKSSTAAYDVNAVREARAFLDNWRGLFEQEVNAKLDDFLNTLKAKPPGKPYTPTTPKPGQPVHLRTYDRAVDAWRSNNAQRLQSMSTAQLRIHYTAARVLRHAPDIIAMQGTLDIQDVTIVAAMAAQALDILQKDLAQDGNDQIIDALLSDLRLPDPVFDPVVLEELHQDAIDRDDQGPHPALIIPELTTNLTWTHLTSDQIESGIREYLKENRWNALGSHFGALIQDLKERLFPNILNDPDALKEELTPETAVFISLLKATIAPDHTDAEEDVIAWWEEMQLWIEDHDLKEIPPGTIRELADTHGIPLLKISQPPLF